ncbi:hypothetical protein ACFOUP_00785 [Belliella kenyensis]|uniref:Uncharacterized protein n=1 Tax=Belliella kenyensis TaxID=1472724 RepID=A0ABV8EGZ8_9BACT|nr:hypothetical protein [Belliella kenyensis]MCH7401768.1 hypothetical protein [Belliella kenyensis]MDN3604267.1 hypothetical protein [Belliella kenyensis]
MAIKNLEKTVLSTLEKLDKLKLDEKLYAELSWCYRSYENDQNPVGVIEKSNQALELLKAKREESPRAVSKKLIEDLEKLVSAE